MKLLHISDTHNQHRTLQNLPDADIIIHSGDMTDVGTENELLDFLNWFLDLPYKYKIFVAGNHDFGLHNATIDGLDENCYYLNNSGVTIEGVRFYGVPLSVADDLSGDNEKNIRKIPKNTDILITHQPPYCILDLDETINFGDKTLLKTVLKVQPKFHLFGHIHKAYGIENNNNTTFVNAALLDEHYNMANKPVLLEI